MTITDFYTLALANGGLRLFLVGKEHIFNHRSATWVACNFGMSMEDATRLVRKADKLCSNKPVEDIPPTYTNKTSSYCEMLAYNYVNPKCGGENYHPFFCKEAGIYYALSSAHREQFDKIVNIAAGKAPMVIDTLYRRASITGLAAEHNTSMSVVSSAVNHCINKLDVFVPAWDIHPRTVMYLHNLKELAICNEFVNSADYVFEFLESDEDIETYTKCKGLPTGVFTMDVKSCVTALYHLMQNCNYLLVMDKPTPNIQPFTKKGVPFSSKWVYLPPSNSIL